MLLHLPPCSIWALIKLQLASQGFVGSAKVSYTSDEYTSASSNGGGGIRSRGRGRHRAAERFESGGRPRHAVTAAAAPPNAQEQLHGGGAFTCQTFDPATQMPQANATLIRRMIVEKPVRLPSRFSNVSQPSAGDIISFTAAVFGIPASSLQLEVEPVDADKMDALGMRHLRFQQVQSYMGDMYG